MKFIVPVPEVVKVPLLYKSPSILIVLSPVETNLAFSVPKKEIPVLAFMVPLLTVTIEIFESVPPLIEKLPDTESVPSPTSTVVVPFPVGALTVIPAVSVNEFDPLIIIPVVEPVLLNWRLEISAFVSRVTVTPLETVTELPELGMPPGPLHPVQILVLLHTPVVIAVHIGAACTLFTETKEKVPNNVIINKREPALKKDFMY